MNGNEALYLDIVVRLGAALLYGGLIRLSSTENIGGSSMQSTLNPTLHDTIIAAVNAALDGNDHIFDAMHDVSEILTGLDRVYFDTFSRVIELPELFA